MPGSGQPISSRPVAHLRIDGVSFAYPDRRVLTDVSVVVPAGRPTALIGENGSGKSTLLRIAAGHLQPANGLVTTVGMGDNPQIGLLQQQRRFHDADTIASVLEEAIASVRRAAERVDHCAERLAHAPDDARALDDYANALEDAERLRAWNIDARVAAMRHGLGLGALPPHRPAVQFSGGQRARLALAALLLSAPDVLLLDEPTNHLDDGGAAYLRREIMAWPGPVLLASHDRAFLDETVSSLVDLDPVAIPEAITPVGTTQFTGTLTEYVAAQDAARVRWEIQFRDEQAELSRLRAAVRRNQIVGHSDWKPRSETRMAKKFYADRNATVVSRRVNDARQRLELLEKQQMRKPPQSLRFAGLGESHPLRTSNEASAMLSTDEVSVRGRLAPVTLQVQAGEKVLVTGPNGAGKSTLLGLIAGQLEATAGTVHVASRAAILTQQVELPDPGERGPSRTARQVYTDVVGEGRSARVPLETFGLLAPHDCERPLAALSLGQQRRLALATLLADPPELLLLDEPTHHLSLRLVNELERAIARFQGTVIVASHDRLLRRRWEGTTIELNPVFP